MVLPSKRLAYGIKATAALPTRAATAARRTDDPQPMPFRRASPDLLAENKLASATCRQEGEKKGSNQFALTSTTPCPGETQMGTPPTRLPTNAMSHPSKSHQANAVNSPKQASFENILLPFKVY